MNINRVMLLVMLMLGCSWAMSAQGFYDDDIYYNPSKTKKTAKKPQTTTVGTTVYDYPAADFYTIDNAPNRDVDEYNRRGAYAQADTMPSDSLMMQDFEYTQRIERFYNPDVVKGSTDEELKSTYYSSVESPEINVYYIDTDPWLWGTWYYPYSWRYYSPYSPYYYSSWWGPSWYYTWGYDPYWGPSWYPGYYPGYYPHHHPHHPHPGYAPAPSHRHAGSGAYRPARPNRHDGYNSGRRPNSSRSDGQYNGKRPGARSNGTYNSSRSSSRSNDRNSSVGNRSDRSNRSSNKSYDSNSTNRRSSSSSSYSSPSRGGSRGGSSMGSRGVGGHHGGSRNGRH